MAKAMTLVGLDVHARRTHAAVLRLPSGELAVSRLRMAPEEVVSFLERLPGPVVAVYEAGPTGFGLARAAAGARDRCAGHRARVDPEGFRGSGQDRPA